MESGLYVVDSRFLVSGTWTPDYNNKRDFGFLELNSQFWIPQAKFAGLRNPDYFTGWGVNYLYSSLFLLYCTVITFGVFVSLVSCSLSLQLTVLFQNITGFLRVDILGF